VASCFEHDKAGWDFVGDERLVVADRILDGDDFVIGRVEEKGGGG
jgi:hypothetical protein